MLRLRCSSSAVKVDITYVPYPGGAPAVNALLREHVTSVL
jgi:tripartite-type tricarboxylate transporter receptor subunit TctC